MLDGVKQTLLIIKMRKYEARLKQLSDDPDFPLTEFEMGQVKTLTPEQYKILEEYGKIQKEYLAVVKESKELRAK